MPEQKNKPLNLSPLVFGAWAVGGWMWGGSNKKDAIEAIHASIENGITTIDTAPVYGFGDSESIVGEAIKPYKNKVQILTKYGLVWDKNKGTHYFDTKKNDGTPVSIYKYAGKQSVIDECEKSLKRLGVDKIDLYQIHWSDITSDQEETMEAIDKLKEQGKIIAGGVCNYGVPLLKEACQHTTIYSNQVPYSMLERSIEEKVVPYCIKEGIHILAYSPLQRGLLTGKIKPDHHFNEGDHRQNNIFFTKDNINKVNHFLSTIAPIAEHHKVTLAQLVLQWTLCQPGISNVLAGARNAKQAQENAGSLTVKLSNEEIQKINRNLNSIQLER